MTDPFRFDRYDSHEVSLSRDHRHAPAGPPISLDEERSPESLAVAQAAVDAAELEGDRYRRLSRRSSLHEVD